jgi:hypothetical protein
MCKKGRRMPDKQTNNNNNNNNNNRWTHKAHHEAFSSA